MRTPAIGVGWDARRALALLTALAVATSLFMLYSGTARAEESAKPCYEDVAVTQYRYEKQIKDQSGAWVRAPEGLQFMGPDEWVDDPVDITNRPGGPWTLGEPKKLGYDWYRYIELTREDLRQVEIPCQVSTTTSTIVDTTTTSIEDTTSTSVEDTTTTSVEDTTTTSVEDTTTTSVEDTTTTSVEDTTTTSVEDTTTTSVEDTTTTSEQETTTTTDDTDVLPTVVTTTPDEVDDDDELPFTGLNSDVMFGIAILLLGAGAALLAMTRRVEDGS